MNDQERQGSRNKPLQPTEEGQRIVTLFADIKNKQIDVLDTSCKNIIERVATFLTVLFAITAFGNSFPPPYLKGNPAARMMVVITLIFYLAAMGSGLWALQPQYYRNFENNVSGMKGELEKITRHKMNWLRAAGALFGLGSLALALLIVSIILAVQ